MKKTLLLILTLAAIAFANNFPWYLQTCYWGNFGYEYGYIGIYEQNGTTIQLFMGQKYCPYTIYR